MNKARRAMRRKVNPKRYQAILPRTGGGVFYDPASEKGRAITAAMEAVFGPSTGRTVAVGSSDNLRFR